jgi:putative transposase
MRRTFKYRLYPTKKQITALNEQLELCRWVYNQSLEIKKSEWENNHKSLSLFDLNKLLTFWIKQKSELKQVYSQVLQNCQTRVDLAYKAFFRRCKLGQKPGFPRFKGFGRYDSMTYKQSGFHLHPTDSTLYLSKIDRIPVILHRPVQGGIKTCSVIKNGTGKWFVCFSCETDKPVPLPKTNKIVGIDLGLKTLVQGSDGLNIKPPKFFRKEEKDLAKAQKKLEKIPKKTPEREKQKRIVSRVHERINNRRNDFCHKLANKLVKSYDLICHEKLNIDNMLEQKKYSKSIADASWAKLLEMITYKAEEAGRLVIPVDPRNTSQLCSTCGTMVLKDITVRQHHCPYCGLDIDRDLNASLNILRLGLESVGLSLPKPPGFCKDKAHRSPRL